MRELVTQAQVPVVKRGILPQRQEEPFSVLSLILSTLIIPLDWFGDDRLVIGRMGTFSRCVGDEVPCQKKESRASKLLT